MFEKFLIEQNIHWQNKFYFDGYKRKMIEYLIKLVSIKQIIAITGIRRCGKSTILKQLINFLIFNKKVNPKNILFCNLESPHLIKFKNNSKNLQNIFEEYLVITNPKGKIYIFLDEVHFFNDWQVFVKNLYENSNVKFFITGSNSKLLSAEMASMLSGRSIELNLKPFSFNEILLSKNIKIDNKFNLAKNEVKIVKLFNDYLKLGGFPEVFQEKNKEIKKEILINYYKNILYQDIIPRFEVKKTKEIEKLLLYLFSNIGQNFSYNSLAKYLRITDKTAKEYISFFEKSFLITEISNYQFSLKKQENYPKKVYAIDNGFIDAVSFSFSENYSHFLENLVFINLAQKEKEIYYFYDKYECDFVIKEKNKVIEAIQVTKNIHYNNRKRELNGLKNALNKFNLKTGKIITQNQEEKFSEDGFLIHIVPAWKWLL